MAKTNSKRKTKTAGLKAENQMSKISVISGAVGVGAILGSMPTATFANDLDISIPQSVVVQEQIADVNNDALTNISKNFTNEKTKKRGKIVSKKSKFQKNKQVNVPQIDFINRDKNLNLNVEPIQEHEKINISNTVNNTLTSQLAEPNVLQKKQSKKQKNNSVKNTQLEKAEVIEQNSTVTSLNSTVSADDENAIQAEKGIELKDIRVVNLKHVKPATLTRGLKVGIGSRYHKKLNPEVQRNLMESGFFKSVDVSLNNKDSSLIIQVEENPIVGKVDVKGAKSIRANDIKNNMELNNIGEGGVLNPSLLNALGEELKNELLTHGKENPKVSIDVQRLEESDLKEISDKKAISNSLSENDLKQAVKVKVEIDEGATTRIKSINFKGNTRFSNSELKRKITSSESGGLNFMNQNSKFNPKQLYSDFEIILNEYKTIGYANASIPDVKFLDVGNEKEPLKAIEVTISEGDKYIFGKPEFIVSESAKPLLNEATLIKLNKVKAGKVFNRNELLKTQSGIENHLANQGRPFAKVNINFKEGQSNNEKVFIPQFSIEAYQEAVIRNININGVTKTKGETVIKELRQKSGEVFNKSKLEVTNTKLQQTGFYRDVEMTTVPASTQNNDVIDSVDVNINVKERRTGNATASAGYMQGNGIFFGAAISDKNAFGTGKTMGLDTQFSRSSKQLNAIFTDPHLFGQDKSLDLNIYGTDYDPRKLKTGNNDYRLRRYGGAATVGLPISDFNKVYLGVGAEQMDLKTFGNSPLQYRKFINSHGSFDNEGNGQFKGLVTKATASWSHNTTTDHYWGGSGHIASVGAETTLPGSKVKYVKAQASYKQFFEIGKNSTLMLHGQAGWGKGIGQTKDFPFFQNYQAGGIGGTPVRAFDSGTIGPKVFDQNNNVITLGGNNMVGLSAELNTKIPFTKDNSDMRVGVFVDAASVWDNKTYTPKDSDNGHSVYNQATYKSTMKNELRAATGVAWTWYSPVGAIKLSYGVPLKKKDHDQVQRFQFSLGKVF